MAFIFIPMELFKIQGFFMRAEGGPAYYSICSDSKSHSRPLSGGKVEVMGVLLKCEVIVYSAVNDVTMGMM